MAGNKKELRLIQFVCFKTRPSISSDIFQETWIPVARSFLLRGINVIVLSERCSPWNGSFSYISKNVWDSSAAIKETFGPKGLPVPTDTVGPIEAVQVGCFHLASHLCTGEFITERHYSLVKESVKIMAMLPLLSTNPSLKEIAEDAKILSSLKGFQSYVIYELDKVSQPSPDTFWFYSWVFEGYFCTEDVGIFCSEVEQISSKLNHRWEIDIHKDNVQLTP